MFLESLSNGSSLAWKANGPEKATQVRPLSAPPSFEGIMADEVMVLLDELEHGAYYQGDCRNASIARWNAETNQFVYMRTKFTAVYPEEIGYWIEAKSGEERFDEFKPFSKVDNPPFEIPMTAYMTNEEHAERARRLIEKK